MNPQLIFLCSKSANCCTAVQLGPTHMKKNALDWDDTTNTHQRLGAVFGGRLKLSNIGRGLLLNGMSPLGGLTAFWLGCRGNWQEHWRRCWGEGKIQNSNLQMQTAKQQILKQQLYWQNYYNVTDFFCTFLSNCRLWGRVIHQRCSHAGAAYWSAPNKIILGYKT